MKRKILNITILWLIVSGLAGCSNIQTNNDKLNKSNQIIKENAKQIIKKIEVNTSAPIKVLKKEIKNNIK